MVCTRRAYAALLANPLPAARLQSLRHLVHAMTQDRQLQVRLLYRIGTQQHLGGAAGTCPQSLPTWVTGGGDHGWCTGLHLF